MSKIVFLDIDGTLLGREKKLSESAKEAVFQLQKNGVYTAIATGRGPFMFASLRKELGIGTYISFNGQYVVFENEVIYQNPLNKHDLQELSQRATLCQHPLVFMNEKTMKANIDYHHFIESGLNSLYMPMPEKDERFFINEDIYQVLLFCEEMDEAPYKESFTSLNFIRWHEVSTDVLPKGGSKARGIAKILDGLRIRMEDVYVFGDGLNDVEMFKCAGTAVAMGNALPEVKKHADIITTHVDEDGVWNGLKQLKLI